MFSLKVYAIITGALFAAIIVMAIAGNVLHDQGLLPDNSGSQVAARVIFFGLFLAFGYSTIPLMVKLVLAGQDKIGNADVGIVRTLAAHQTGVIVAFWTLITLGLAIAIPAAIQDGFFDADPAAEIAKTPSRGTLVVRPGMTVDDMHRLSSLKIKGSPTSVFADGTLFDFNIAGTGITLPRCRYYYITTYSKDRSRIEMMSVGTAQSKMSRPQLEAANEALRARLAGDGWLTGHEVYRSAQDQTLHGGATRGPSGAVWLKGDTVLHIEARRMDDARPGEAPGTGEWIQFVELGERISWPGFARYAFEPAK